MRPTSQPTSASPDAPALRGGTILLLAALYCAQGLPSGLIAHALPVMLRQHGVDLAVIGALKLIALPWMLKVLWAPWIDRLSSRRLGHHRGWILPMQAAVLAGLAAVAMLPPDALFGPWLPVFLGLLLLLNLAAATQDVAADGLAVRLLPARWRGLGNSLQVGGYKAGMIVGGSLLLLVVEPLGWRTSIGLLAGLVALMAVPVLLFPEQRRLPRLAPLDEPAGPALLWRHYRGFLARPGVGAWLLVVLLYKLGDAVGSPMIKPMLVDQGWTSAALGRLTLVSSAAGIGGAVLGGLVYARLGAVRSLAAFGLLQAAGIAAMAWLAGGAPVQAVYAVALFEQVADAMSTVALFAVMMDRCRAGHEGGDYTFQACLQVLAAGAAGAFSGVAASALGYGGHFVLAGLLGVPAIVLAAHGGWRGMETAPAVSAPAR
ncbi:MFS transporter [Noviherbaspirillum aridicola]|uniref:MFS transporter n=1 Tax=Noviherbaspirillum aridicola TaxID=2849687 RepID=A0ABQ4Q8I9_9BURK|nr:MFS transporter [Noviherbaspirillum aridicola]GIZ53366.1 MFS transporter [Noviherbaspirillum aridicola]